jgi:uncharacterized protein (DUF885 family)
MRHSTAALLATIAMATMIAAPSMRVAATERSNAADTAFAKLGARYVDELARMSPVNGTQLGDHRFDDKLPDLSAAGRGRVTAAEKSLFGDLGRIDRSKLTRDNQVDWLLLDNALRADIWDAEVLQSWAWNAQIYNDMAAGALYSLAARDYAPWPQRLKAATARMEALPALLAQGRQALVIARVPAVYATTVAKQNAGIMEIANGMLAPHAGELSPAERSRFDAALAGLAKAVADQQHWLDTVLVPQAKGDFRIGPKLYDQEMRFSLMSNLTRGELKARAAKAVIATRAEMYTIARQVLANKPGAPALPATPTPEQQQAAIEAALSQTYAHRPARNGLEAQGRRDLAEATAFVRGHNLVTMPDGPVRIITMPKFQQGNAVAYCDPPGALERGQQTFVAISPIPAEWTDAQATSFLSEYNDYMVQDLIAHEAMPGHYLQLDHANRNPSTLRAVLFSSPFAEGWAVYAEGLMADQGYMNSDPLFRLTVLKMRLRSITNTLLDIGIHTEGMSRDQAMELMTKTAFQQEREAAGKWVRASLSSTQLLSYFTGYTEQMEMRAEAQRRLGTRFDLKRYNDGVLAHGTPPSRFVRELMFNLPIS